MRRPEIKCILADDDKFFRNMLKKMIMDNWPEIKIVFECSTLESLKTSIEVHHPRLVILDTILSGVSSFELYGRLSKISECF